MGLLKGFSRPKFASMVDPQWGLDFLCVKERVDFTPFMSLVCREDKKITAMKALFYVAAIFECVSISNIVTESFGVKEGLRTG